MASIHSSRPCLPKLCCSIVAIGFFITGILLTGAYPRQDLDHFKLSETDVLTNRTNFTSTESPNPPEIKRNRISRSLKTTVAAAQSKAVQAILLAYIFRHTDTQAAILHQFISSSSTPKSRASRSPRTFNTIQALEAASARFDQYQPKPEYQVTEYATGNRRWKRAPGTRRAGSPGSSATTKEETTTEWFLRNLATSPFPIQTIRTLEKALHILTRTAPQKRSEYATGIKRSKREPSVYPFQITDLLEYEVRNKHSQNKILGEKVAKILHQNTDLSDEIAADYQTPSEKLKKDPIMALVTKTLSTYMLVRHSKNGKEKSQEENLSPWGEPFFKKKE
jgi:hypothetical protein